jgi:Flp pilus assembly pilin Flp
MNALKNLVADEKGLETVEYAIITGLVVAGTITAIAAIGAYVKTQFENLKTNLAA